MTISPASGWRRSTPGFSIIVLTVTGAMSGSSGAAPPDHIVIVVEENHSFTSVIGNEDAPFLNALANSGALLTDSHGILRPSQPNYLHIFSGSNQGVYDNEVPIGTPFTTPNLAASLLISGRTFAGYSEGLPEVGFLGAEFGAYRRKHNPWSHWQADPAGPNQLSPELNRPFDHFPTDFTQLPTLCFVIPDMNNGMHDGTIAQADQWLAANIGAYAQWCADNNSLLIITWDEDENRDEGNHIATIFHGPMIRTGQHPIRCTHHSVLRTIEDMYALPHLGASDRAQPLVGLFLDDPEVHTVTFQQGAGAYSAARDTYLDMEAPDTERSTETSLVVDDAPRTQALVAFGDLGAIPRNATIISASLAVWTGDMSANASRDEVSLHRMLVPWTDSNTWNSLVNGVSTDDAEAAAEPDFTLVPSTKNMWEIFNVTATLQDWVNGSAPVNGWVLVPSGGDGWQLFSSEHTDPSRRPHLSVSYVLPSCAADFNHDGFADSQDFFDFLTAFFTGSPSADFNHDMTVNSQDFFDFLSVFFVGC